MAKPWFRTKQYGYGASLPCSWEGWAAFILFMAVMIGLSALPEALTQPRPWLGIAVRVSLTVGFIVLVWRKSDKPWGWRWRK
ncbi:hypothetical protein [Caulobacter sp. DWR1-3-2b1]|uniref:hypothetical protein n=1 Tax=Caulobacter sp. DWR1-3-2b1 TaxID=2804670 RepID=UPI003CF5BA55